MTVTPHKDQIIAALKGVAGPDGESDIARAASQPASFLLSVTLARNAEALYCGRELSDGGRAGDSRASNPD